MNYKIITCCVISILCMCIPAVAPELFYVSGQNSGLDLVEENLTADSQYSIILQEIPQELLSNVTYIDRISLLAGAGYYDDNSVWQPTDGKLYVKFYKKVAGIWYYQSGGYFPAQSVDYGSEIYLNLNYPIYIDKGYDYGVGFWTDATVGTWDLLGSHENYGIEYSSWKTTNGRICNIYSTQSRCWTIGENQYITGIISSTRIMPKMHKIYSDGALIANQYSIYMTLFGQTDIPSIPPTPPPLDPTPDTTTENTTGDCGSVYDSYSGSYLNISCSSDIPMPGFENNGTFNFSAPQEACPECIGNESLVPDTISGTAQISQTMQGLGYCTTQGCKLSDFIDILYDSAILLFVVSLVFCFFKFSMR